GGADAGRADAEGQGIEPSDVEADHQGAEVVVGTGADGAAGAGQPEEGEQAGGDRQRQHGGDHAHLVDQQRADLDRVERVVDQNAARIGAEDHQQRIDHDDGHGGEQDELAVFRAVDEGIDQDRLHDIAEREEDYRDRHHGHQGVDVPG